MLVVRTQSKFEKDLERMKRRGKDLDKLQVIMLSLIQKKPLAPKHRDHPLKGQYAYCRECHIEPDWLLIYAIEEETITFIRSGSHADLFK